MRQSLRSYYHTQTWCSSEFLFSYFLYLRLNALATQILIWGLFALAFNIVYSNSGLFWLGHAAFYGLGAYGTGLILPSAYGTGAIIARFKVESLPISLAAGALFAGAGALIIGFFCLRRRGIYFPMLTLAFSQLLYFTAYQASSLTGGHSGLRGIPAFTLDLGPFQIPLDHPINFYYFTLVLVGLCVLAMQRILNSPFGAVIRAVRDNEIRAAACGHNVHALKLLSFFWSGLFAGVAGSLSALTSEIVSVNVFHSVHIGRSRDDDAARWRANVLWSLCGRDAVPRPSRGI